MMCLLLSSSLLLVGCSSNTTKTENKTDDTNRVVETENSTLFGRIETISEKELTLITFGGGGAPGEVPSGGQGGVPGAKPSGEPEGIPGEKPSGNPGGASGETPERPNDEAKDISSSPNAEASGTPADMPQKMEGETKMVTLTDSTKVLDENKEETNLSTLKEGTMVTIDVDSENNALTITIQANTQKGGGPGEQSAPESYTSKTEYKEDTEVDGTTFDSTGTDENAIHVLDGAKVMLHNITLTRTSEDSTGGDSSSFYGIGAGLLVTDGTVTVKNSTITTDAAGGTGIFSYGSGVAEVSDTTIKTSQNTSGGIHVAGGGTLHATNLTVETQGESSAAIRSDRGSGTMTIDGGTYTSNGIGSPAVYSTADISIKNATLTATGSEAVCIEGLNSLKLTDCNITGNMPENEQNDCIWTIILYQSMSGDSEEGNSVFEMTGGSITSKNGGLLYTTNTESTFSLSNVNITYSDSNDFFLKCTGNSNARGWGQSGSNGANCQFTAQQQEMKGSMIWDSISDLDVTMKDGSQWTGVFIKDETNAGDDGDGYANLTIDETSSWIVTGDSELSSLTCNGTIVDEGGKTVTILGSDGTSYVEGTGSYIITVDSYAE